MTHSRGGRLMSVEKEKPRVISHSGRMQLGASRGLPEPASHPPWEPQHRFHQPVKAA